ncbi:MAG: hypothetical protein M2R45_04046 [Verrucomicrobia subdivision 3 bacterium]|nr:hypothetical protein [Limisphaerales bacterium]MCS1416970.1 hypothetical protein [Limisphaerales bacterium]
MIPHERLSSLPRQAMIGGTVVAASLAIGQDTNLPQLPAAADHTISFKEDVLPILEGHCFQCHGDERPKSGFNLRHRETALKGGDHGEDIIPGDSANSPLIHYVAYLEEDMEMPPIGKAERLTSQQVATLRAWIDQGAAWDAREDDSSLQYIFEPTIGYVTVSGDERKFREHWWQDDGFTGGIAELSLKDQLKEGTRVELHSRSIFQTEDHEIELSFRKPDLGIIQFGYDQFRRYYDDTGGYYEALGQDAPSLNRDLYLDNRRAWIDVGLTLPNWPTIVLGYEYQHRDGEKSMIHQGLVFPTSPPGAAGKGIFPSSKHINEETHIIKLDVQHEQSSWQFENSFRGEFTEFETRRETADFVDAGSTVPASATRVEEDYDHFNGANTIYAEKQVKPWWLLSGGYLFSDLSADAGFNLETFLPADLSAAPFQGDISRGIILDRDSHVINVNSLFGPWDGLSFFAGVQNDWTSQSGDGDLLLFGTIPTRLGSNLDQITTEENFGLRYTKLRNTVVYADAKFQQVDIGQKENQFVDDGFPADNDFMRDTNATIDHKEYRTGLTYSPWRWASIDAWHRRRLRQNDYNHALDTDLGTFAPPGNGFSAFIRSRNVDTDDFQVKLTLRPASRVRTTLSYRLTATDYDIATDPVVDVFGTAFSAGRSHSGNYDAHIYTLSNTIQPSQRIRLTGTTTISDLRTVSELTDSTLLAPYEGQIYTFLGTANVIVNKTLTWDTTYSFSKADFRQNDTGLNLPLGIDYDRHGVITGFSQQLNDTSSLRLHYGFFKYDEPSLVEANDYTAYGLFATFRRSFQ